jgi:mannose-1-phosphate guanylyltransferase
MRPISIDYGVMEKVENRFVFPADFGWNDLGSWDEVARIFPKDGSGNATDGETILRDCTNVHISTVSGRVAAAVGVEDVIVIDTADAVLVCRKGRSQDVKDIVDHLRKKGMTPFL